MTSVRGSLLLLSWLSFFLLSLLRHRLINWKPRRFATRWTLCGTRRSLTAESPRKTCTAKHSGKCLEASVLFISSLSEDRSVSSHLSSFCLSCALFTVFTPRLFSLGSLSFLPPLNLYLQPVLHIAPVLTTFPLLNPRRLFPLCLASCCFRSSCGDRLRSAWTLRGLLILLTSPSGGDESCE